MEGITVSKRPEDDVDELLQTPFCDALSLTAKEREVLKLWDLSEDLRLEQAILRAQADVTSHGADPTSGDELDRQIEAAHKETLEARAAYVLRNRIIQQTLITDPILKAVHTGAEGESPSQKIAELVNERDMLAMLNSKLSQDLQMASADLLGLERQSIALTAQNQELAATMLGLAAEVQQSRTEDVDDPALRHRLQQLDREVRVARRDWRVMKSVVSAVVAGSGINWARDEALAELVLDDETDV